MVPPVCFPCKAWSLFVMLQGYTHRHILGRSPRAGVWTTVPCSIVCAGVTDLISPPSAGSRPGLVHHTSLTHTQCSCRCTRAQGFTQYGSANSLSWPPRQPVLIWSLCTLRLGEKDNAFPMTFSVVCSCASPVRYYGFVRKCVLCIWTTGMHCGIGSIPHSWTCSVLICVVPISERNTLTCGAALSRREHGAEQQAGDFYECWNVSCT